MHEPACQWPLRVFLKTRPFIRSQQQEVFSWLNENTVYFIQHRNLITEEVAKTYILYSFLVIVVEETVTATGNTRRAVQEQLVAIYMRRSHVRITWEIKINKYGVKCDPLTVSKQTSRSLPVSAADLFLSQRKQEMPKLRRHARISYMR